MNTPTAIYQILCRLLTCALASTALLLTSCGGGGDSAGHPAPQTLNGLVLELQAGGIQISFVRNSGSALNGGTETGVILVRESAPSFTFVDEFGNLQMAYVSQVVQAGTYTYQKTAAETGAIVVRGDGSGSDSSGNTATYFATAAFEHRYEVLFATDGSILTDILVTDTGEGFTIFWNEALLTHYDGGDVPIGYSLSQSEGRDLPKLYPDTIDRETFEITPDNPLQPTLYYVLLASEFTRFVDLSGQVVLEKGVGNEYVPPDLVNVNQVVNWEYAPDTATINKVIMRISYDSLPTVTYTLTFSDLESGTYVDSLGRTGTFVFPFLTN